MKACRVEEPGMRPGKDAEPPLPPRCAGSPARCRVGDWEYPAFIFEWWGSRDIQRYQPGCATPFDPAGFDPERPVWLFERCPHPAVKFNRGTPCDVWKRIR